MTSCVRFIVSGRVQGVFYRQSTMEKARELGLSGWVKNLTDGSVEVCAQGEAASMQTLQDWLWQGPPAAAVSDVQSEAADVACPALFEIRY